MEKVYISDSGPKVSKIIYGFWRWNAPEDLSKTEEVVNHCLQNGIQTFDHADIYGNYQIEENFGKIFQSKSIKREEVVLFSKAGICKTSQGQTYYNTSSEHIFKSIDESLRKLHTDYIDVFLLHHPDHITPLEETAKALAHVVATGKVKRVGVSNFSVFQHQKLASFLPFPIVTNHIELNLHNLSALEDGRVDFLKQQFCKPLAWAPLAGGKISHGKDLKSELIRNKLEAIAQEHQAHIEQVAVAWLLQLGTLPIVGTLNKERITNAANATNLTLSHEHWYEIYHLAKSL